MNDEDSYTYCGNICFTPKTATLPGMRPILVLFSPYGLNGIDGRIFVSDTESPSLYNVTKRRQQSHGRSGADTKSQNTVNPALNKIQENA